MRRRFLDRVAFRGSVAGRADDEALAALGGELGESAGERMMRELDEHVAPIDDREDVVAFVDAADEFQRGILRAEAQQRLAPSGLSIRQ